MAVLDQDTYREHGLDLRAVVQVDLASYLRNSTTLCLGLELVFFKHLFYQMTRQIFQIVNPPEPRCMPAIVPLDRETQKGTLLVVSAGMLKGFELHQLFDHKCFHLLVRGQQDKHG